VSPPTFPSRGAHCWSVGPENGAPPGTIRRIWLVGKRTTNSNRNILATTSFPGESSRFLVPFHVAGSLCWLPRNPEYLSGLRSTAQTRSCGVRCFGSRRNATDGRCPRKLFDLHALPIAVRRRGLTGESPKRYIPVRRGRSRCGGLSKSPNGPVEGLSPENVESAV